MADDVHPPYEPLIPATEAAEWLTRNTTQDFDRVKVWKWHKQKGHLQTFPDPTTTRRKFKVSYLRRDAKELKIYTGAAELRAAV